jgi:hypothetical protein
MPAASNGVEFVIDDISRPRGDLPFEGSTYRYVVDVSKREFRIPLSAYRSGIDNKGSFTVNIKANTEIISTVNESKQVPYLLLPSDKYSIVSSVEMKNGEELAKFDLIVNLDFLLDNFPDKIYAIGVEISSPQRDTNPKLATTAVVINTKMIRPTANFTYSENSSQDRYFNFTNSSTMADRYQWNFGDGSEVSTATSPTHKYSSSGLYTVTLSAFGVTGEEGKSEYSIKITVP